MDDYKNDNINALLIQAAKNRDWLRVWGFLEEGADPNATDENGLRPIDFALRQANLGAIDLLLDYGASVENVPGIIQLSRDKENDWLCIFFSRGNFGRGIYFRPAQRASGRYAMPIENWSGTKSLTSTAERWDMDALDYAINSGTNIDDIPGIVARKGDWRCFWLTRGAGEVLYWRRAAHVLTRYGTLSEEDKVGPHQIERALLKALHSLVEELFPLTRLLEEQEAEAPEKSNDAEIRHDNITEFYQEPERCAVPVPSEAAPFTIERENLAEAKEKKAKKRRKAHHRKLSSRDGDPNQLNFFNELGLGNI